MSGKIAMVAMGEVEAQLLVHVCAAVREAFDRSCYVGEVLATPASAFNSRRAQYSAETILEQLHSGPAERILGVVDLDLYVPQLNFVFGLADRVGRRAVIALPRLRERFYGGRDDEALFRARVVKEAVHELGHTYGLGHCSNRRCVMTFSNSLADTDYKGQEFCPRCRQQLQL